MYYSQINTLFYAIPKNASESISTTITQSLNIPRNHTHTTYSSHDYKNIFTFAVIRNPIERFYSAYTYLQYQPKWKIPVNNVLDLLENKSFSNLNENICITSSNNLDIVFIKQIHYYNPNIIYILFEDLNNFWKIFQLFILKKFNIHLNNLKKNNITPKSRKIIHQFSPSQIKRISNIYSEDIILYNSLKNNTNYYYKQFKPLLLS